MSFLSCLNHPTLVVASVGGISLGVTLLLLPWKSISPLSSPVIQLVSKPERRNCTVSNVSENISKRLPFSDLSYVSVSCYNSASVGTDSMLSKWRGFFPANLLTRGVNDFKVGMQLRIDVKEIKISNDDISFNEANETVFASEQFLKTPLTGRWGSTLVDTIEDNDEAIYKVDLTKSGILKTNFYISLIEE